MIDVIAQEFGCVRWYPGQEADAWIHEVGVAIWAIARYARSVGGDWTRTKDDYALTQEQLNDAREFYRRHKIILDYRAGKVL